MHACCKLVVYRIKFVLVQNMWPKLLALVASICISSKCCKSSKVNSVSNLKHIKVIIADVHSNDVSYAGKVSCRSTHPDDIVVTPLEINIVVVHQIVHNCIRMRTSVIYITYDVKLVNCKSAYGISHLFNKDFTKTKVYNRINNLAVVVNTVFLIVSVKKLIHSIVEILRKSISNP